MPSTAFKLSRLPLKVFQSARLMLRGKGGLFPVTVEPCSYRRTLKQIDILYSNWYLLGQWPKISWMTSGSGQWSGLLAWRTYRVALDCLECIPTSTLLTWNVLKAKLAKKSRADSRPPHGRN